MKINLSAPLMNERAKDLFLYLITNPNRCKMTYKGGLGVGPQEHYDIMDKTLNNCVK
jgi:hypothetical protein